jgi:type III secretion protein Q
LRRIPRGIARVRNALGPGRVWRAEPGFGPWSRFELHWPHGRPAFENDSVDPPSSRSAARGWLARSTLWLQSSAGRFGLEDTTLLQLGSGIVLDRAWPEDVFKDAARLACACMHRQLEMAIGGPFELLRPAPSDESAGPERNAAAPELKLQLLLMPWQGQERHMLSIGASADTFVRLLQRDRWEAVETDTPPWWSDLLRWSVGAPVASVRLNVRTLEALQPGDLIAVAECGAPDLLELRMGSALVKWTAEARDPNTLVCKSWRNSPVSNEASPEVAARNVQSSSSTEDSPADESFPIDDIDISVQFLAGRIDMSVGELRALRAGSLIQLIKHAGARVDIVAGGQRIGIGEMVSIDGLLAIEVVEMSRAP